MDNKDIKIKYWNGNTVTNSQKINADTNDILDRMLDSARDDQNSKVIDKLNAIDWYHYVGGTCRHRENKGVDKYKIGIACKECVMHDCKLAMTRVIEQLTKE